MIKKKPVLGTGQKAFQELNQIATGAKILPTITSSFGNSPQMATATTQAIQSGANPLSLAIAKKQLGDREYIGYCEKFVEQVTKGTTGIYPSAIDAWNQQQDKAVTGLDGVQPGDPVYFAPDSSNQGYGHTGIYAGDNQFVSATDNGIQQNDLGKWQQSTGQQVLGVYSTRS